MKGLIVLLIGLLIGLNYKLWFAKGGLLELSQLNLQITEQTAANDVLSAQNASLSAEVYDLKNGTQAVEEYARHDLGLVNQDETFFHIINDRTNRP